MAANVVGPAASGPTTLTVRVEVRVSVLRLVSAIPASGLLLVVLLVSVAVSVSSVVLLVSLERVRVVSVVLLRHVQGHKDAAASSSHLAQRHHGASQGVVSVCVLTAVLVLVVPVLVVRVSVVFEAVVRVLVVGVVVEHEQGQYCWASLSTHATKGHQEGSQVTLKVEVVQVVVPLVSVTVVRVPLVSVTVVRVPLVSVTVVRVVVALIVFVVMLCMLVV
jgi:hypothetical protein